MKKILLSLLIITLVGAGVFGVTRAYFTDNKTSTGNVLGTGNFDVRMAGQKSDGSRSANMDGKAFFDVDGLMPGEEGEIAYIEVKNESAVDMLFRLYAENISETKSGLRDYLNVKVTLDPTNDSPVYSPVLSGTDYYGPDDTPIYDGPLSGIVGESNALDNVDAACDEDWPLMSDFVAIYKVEISLDWAAPNKYQGQSLTGDLQLDATQHNEEEQCVGYYNDNVNW